jgi:hypothetical protein
MGGREVRMKVESPLGFKDSSLAAGGHGSESTPDLELPAPVLLRLSFDFLMGL